MYHFFLPDLYVRSLADIPLCVLKDRGIRGLIIDLDNTVTEWGRDTLKPEVTAWFSDLKKYDMKACLVSNNRSKRVQTVADYLGIPAISSAGKPRRRAFRHAIALLGTGFDDTAVIGDQVLTDILGGKRLGLLTVLVVPMNSHEFIGTRFMRKIERIFTRRLRLSDLPHKKQPLR